MAARGSLIRRLGGPLQALGPRGRLGALLLALVVAGAIAAPLLAPADPLRLDASALLQGPSLHHPLGTDPYGRDTLARVLYGARRSLWVSVAAVALALLGGGGGGLLAGYFGGLSELVLMRVADVLLALPALLLCLALLAFLDGAGGGGGGDLVLAIGVIYMGPLLRISRAAVLAVRRETYVEASRALGASDWGILWRTILPNAAGPILIEASLRLGYALLAEASLSFLGLGTSPPNPSWGEMIADGRRYLLLSPWGTLAPGVMIAVSVLGFNLLGDGLRAALDSERGSA